MQYGAIIIDNKRRIRFENLIATLSRIFYRRYVPV